MGEAKYRITHVEPRSTFGPDRRPLDGYDVFFEELESGFTGQIFIPMNQFTAERVAETVQPLADALLTTSRLGQ